MSRKFPLLFIALTLTLAALACNFGQATSNPAAADSVSTGKMVEYVGEISETNFFVAIAIGPAGDVLAYICDGMGTDYLFHGTAQGNALDLISDEGQASLQAEPNGQGFAGTFSVNGKAYSFTSNLAQDYGGLYRVIGLTEFEAEGTSQGGATLKMNLTPDKERVQVTVITTDNRRLSFDHLWRAGHDHRDPTEYSESWVIVLNDGRARGGHIKTSLQAGVRHIDPICPP